MGTDDSAKQDAASSSSSAAVGGGGSGEGRYSSNDIYGQHRVNDQDREAWNAKLSQRRQERRQARLRKVSGHHNSSTNSNPDMPPSTTSGGSSGSGGGGMMTHNNNHHDNNHPYTPSKHNMYYATASPSITANNNGGTTSNSLSFMKHTPRHRMPRKTRKSSFGINNRSKSKVAAIWLIRIGVCSAGLLLGLWIMGLAYLTSTTSSTTATTGDEHSFFHPGFSNPFSKKSKNTKVHATTISNNGQIIDMRQLVQTMKFDNPDGGAWKQGWDVQPLPLDPNDPLQIYVVPHSHCDPGWIKTFDEYFQTQTKEILTTVIRSLAQDSRRKFIWAEISYFEWWWKEQDDTTQHLVRKLLHDRQFEFVTGGWVQPDEANTQLYAMEIQLQEGHDFIRKTFGEEYIPKFGWSIDPFGYSPTMAYLLKKYNFEGMLIQRVHYAVKKELALNHNLEFLWRQTWDNDGEFDIFTHVMPFYSYDVPHTCGPDPAVCCQFDFARLPHARNKRVGRCPWAPQPKTITEDNVAERAMLLLDQYRKKANLYASRNTVLIPLGDDFRWQQMREADAQYQNYQMIFDYINQNVNGVQIQWGTLSEYFNKVLGREVGSTSSTYSPQFDPPLLKGSFFTYADRNEDYWSGYFTSRVFDKALDRKLERVLYAASSLGATKEEMQEPRRALSLFQHHDGVTGTAKRKVVLDYADRIHSSIRVTQEWIAQNLHGKLQQLQQKQLRTADNNKIQEQALVNVDLQPCWQSRVSRLLSENLCPDDSQVIVYNPLDTEQSCGNIVVRGRTLAQATLPCEIPGQVHSPLFRHVHDRFQFDPVTGLMTHPIREEWMVWQVNEGGAYLFFPGTLVHYGEVSDAPVVENGGFVVKTQHWKRTIVEKTSTKDEESSETTVLDFIFETNLQNPNEEWFVRFSSEIANDGVFHTDLNGYNFDTHKFRKDMPIQSQVFPMPTLASIEDAHLRMTILSEHAQGTASLQDGSIDVWLDRRLAQDDGRGLGEGVLDNVPTRTRLRVVLEPYGYHHPDNSPEFEITPLCKQLWKELNHPLEVFGAPADHGGSIAADQGGMKDLEDEAAEEKRNLLSFDRSNRADSFISHAEALRKDPYQVPVSQHSEDVVTLRGDDTTEYFVPIVYMVYNRVDYLRRSIDTLRNSDFPRDSVPVVISHDGHVADMVSFVDSLKSEFHIIQLFHPYSCSEHPHTFPGDDPALNEHYKGDAYGNPREGKVTCCKHHFTWMMNQVFDESRLTGYDRKDIEALKQADSFLFLEEDYTVSPTIHFTVQTGLKLLKQEDSDSTKYFGLTLDPSEAYTLQYAHLQENAWHIRQFVSGPMVISRKMFQRIKANAEHYCQFDDYNWDWTIVHLMTIKKLPSSVLCPTRLQVAHIGVEGMHGDGNGMKQKMVQRIQNAHELEPFSGTQLLLRTRGRIQRHLKGYGGWGHPKDHDHCIKVFMGEQSGFTNSLKHLFGFA